MNPEILKIDKAEEGSGFDVPEKKPEVLDKRRQDCSNVEIREDDQYKEEAEEYLESKRSLLRIFAEDFSLRFKLGKAFYIDLERGEVNMDANWFRKKGFSKEQIFWAHLHEVMHFLDYKNDVAGMQDNFNHIDDMARMTGDLLLRRWEKILDLQNPEDLKTLERLRAQKPLNPRKPKKGTMNQLQRSAYGIHHMFYNILDDIWDNTMVQRKAQTYSKGGDADEVKRLYKEKLFPKTDYSDQPLHRQFAYALLRKEMVPDEELTLSPEVQEILSQKVKYMGGEYTPKEIVDVFIKPIFGRDTKSSERYFVIKNTLEQIFIDLLNKDIEKWEPQKPEKSKEEGKGEKDDSGERDENKSGTPENPFDLAPEENPNMPDFDPDDLDDWNDDEENKKEKKAKSKQEAEKSPAKKAEEAENEADKAWAEKEAGGDEIKANELYRALKEYKKYARDTFPYLEELSLSWRQIVFGRSRGTKVEMVGHFKEGDELDVERVIEEFPIIKDGDLEKVRPMLKMETKEVLVEKPELIRVRLVGDLSDSMDEAKKKILKQVYILLSSSLNEFNRYLDLTRKDTKSKLRDDTEVYVFGDIDKAKRVKEFDSVKGLQNIDERRIAIETMREFSVSLGETYDNVPLEMIDKSITEDDVKKMSSGKIIDIVFVITDGGSTKRELTRRTVVDLQSKHVVVKAFQIGNTNHQEKQTFEYVWNTGYTEPNGQIVGEDLSKVVPGVAQLLKRYMKDIRL